MKLLAALLVLFPVVALAQQTNTHDKNHNSYKEWQTPNGLSCCDDTDCDIVKELGIDETTQLLQVLWRGERFLVPDRIKLKDKKSPDGNSHLCVYKGTPICFVQGDAMF